MTTFTATASATFVTLAVADLDQDSLVTITRDPSPGDITVRGTPVELPAGGATVLTDVEYPYGEVITYTAVLVDPTTGVHVETLTTQAGPIALPQDGMVVSDPFSNVQVTLTVIDQREESSAFRGFRYDLAGRSQPLYTTEVHGGWTWTNEWHTKDRTQRQTLDGLLRHGRPVLLRVADCDLRDGWVMPEQIDVVRAGISAANTGRRWNVRVGQIDPPPSTVETAAVTLADVHDYEPTTLQALSDRPPSTLLELSLAVVDAQ